MTETNTDLIQMDMMLLKLTGLRMLCKLKQNHITKQLPFIVLSRLPQSSVAKLQEEGAAAYIEKSETSDNNLRFLIYAIERGPGNILHNNEVESCR